MTEPHDDDLTPVERNYASDRHLLLKEIRLLGSEVARLRGDTKHLNEILVPREEMIRRRRIAMLASALAFLLLAAPMVGFYIQQQTINTDRDMFTKRTLELCEKRNDGNRDLGSLLKALLAKTPVDAPTAGALRNYEKTLDQVDCQTLITEG